MNKLTASLYRGLFRHTRMFISENQKSFLKLKNGRSWSTKDLTEQVESLNIDSELITKTAEVRKIIMFNIHNLTDPSLNKLLKLYGSKLSAVSDLEYFLDLVESKRFSDFDPVIIKRIFEKCKGSMRDLSDQRFLQLILMYSKSGAQVPKNEIEEAIVSKLQYMSKGELFRFLFESRFFTNGVLVDLMMQPEFDSIIKTYENRQLYEVFKQNNIILPEKLQVYFSEEIARDSQDTKAVDEQDELLNIDSLNLHRALALFKKFPKHSTSDTKARLKKHIIKCLEISRSEVKEIADVIDVVLSLEEKDFNEVIVNEFTDELNKLMQNYFEFTNKTEFLTNSLFLFTYVLKRLEGIRLLRKFHVEVNKQLVSEIAAIYESLIVTALLDEKIDANLFTMEEIMFYNSKTTNVEYRLNTYNHTAQSLKPWLQFYNDLLDSGFASAEMLKRINSFFCNVAGLLEPRDLVEFLRINNHVNLQAEEDVKMLNEAVKSGFEGIAALNFDEKLMFYTEYVKFLVLTKNMGAVEWQLIKGLNFDRKDFEQLSLELKVDLYLCKKILEGLKRPQLAGLHIDIPEDFYVHKGKDMTPDFALFFKFLFFEELETDVKYDIVNINYAQMKKALMLFDFDDTVGQTNTLNGSCELIIKYLSGGFNSVTYLTQFELENCEKRNEKMHLLRVNTKGWTVDVDKRTEYYDKSYNEII